jgi:ubiquitin carboxyl-terminal hydrolase 25/28
VLGKRARDKEVVASWMSIDSDNFVIISKSPDAANADADAAGPSRADVEMKDAEAPAQSGAKPPPPLPQSKTSESVMMFDALIIRRLGCADVLLLVGRQHDVSECMDNCVFQIETALLKFDGMDE